MPRWIYSDTDFSRPLPERIMTGRGIEDLQKFLNPDFETHLHSPRLFPSMEGAVERILRARKGNERVFIAGDYDVDGVSSAALLYRILTAIGIDAEVYLPHRIRDGFGLTPGIVDRAAELGVGLIITVDNGITASEAVAAALERDIDTIITDHHFPTEGVPPGAFAVINPAVPESGYPFSRLCGAGVVYKLVEALLGECVADGIMSTSAMEAQLKWNLDLVALATVADVVDLVDENRVLTHYGLKVLGKSRKPGVRALVKVAGCESIDAEAVAFRLGPRLNAAGRLDDPAAAFRLLVTEDGREAAELAEFLEKLNQQRQGLVRRALDAAAEQADRQRDNGERVLLLENSNWHPGIIGLIAGRMCERYNMPVAVFTSDEESAHWTASCRSLPAFDLTRMLEKFHHLFFRSGGHALAAGLTVATENMPLFRESFLSYGREVLEGVTCESEIHIDSSVLPAELTLENCGALQELAPFGQGNREPVLRISGLRLTESRRVGSDSTHFRFIAAHEGGSIVGIGFGLGDLADAFAVGSVVDCAAHLRINEFRGRFSPQLILLDMKPSTPE